MPYVGTYLGVGACLGHYGISVIPEYLLLVCPLVLNHEIFSVELVLKEHLKRNV